MTLERGRSSASGSPFGPIALECCLAVLLALVAVPGGPPSIALAGVEEEDIASQIGEFRKILDEGNKHLSSLDFPEAVDTFTKLIDAYKAGKIPLVTPDARLIVGRAYEGRALSFANLARNADASADFDALIRFDTNYPVELKGVSSKIVTLYLEVRKRIVGTVRVEGDPIGSEVRLNDQSLGLTPVTDKDWIAGSYHLVISHQGFDPLEEDIRVEAGGKVFNKKFKLVPNARSAQFLTVPRDVKVIVDGQERGTTFGTAGSIYEELAVKAGVNRSDMSELLTVEYLTPGAHELVLRRECYEEIVRSFDVKIDPNDNTPLFYTPFVLKPSRGALEIASQPTGAQVFIDGKPAGTTPATLPDICSGKHDLLLAKEGMGRSLVTVDVLNGQTQKVDQKLRLSLAAFDLRAGLREGEGLVAALKGMTRYNLVSPGNGIPAEVADRVRLEVESSQGKGLSEKTVKDLLQSLKVELIALAVPVTSLGEEIEFQLSSPLHPVPDRWRFAASGSEGFRKVLFALESELPVEAAWSGIKLIDVHGKAHPIVLGVTSGSPAAIGGVAAGDLLVSVGGTPIQRASDFVPVLRKASPGEDTVVTVETSGKNHDVKLKYLMTPLLLPVKDPGLLYNKAIADLTQTTATAGDRQKASYAWMNIGVALMHFGRFEEAVRDAFKKAELPDGAGISKGTVRYLTAVCYERLGLQSDARTAYLDASASATATLVSHDGPVLAPSARRRAAAIGASGKS